MKAWQWAVLGVETLLLFGVLGAAAWLLLFNTPAQPPGAPLGARPAQPPAPAAPVAQATLPLPTHSIATPAPTPQPAVWPTPLPTRTPLPTNTRVVSRVAVNQAAIDGIQQKVIALRGLKPRATVSTQFLTRAEMVDHVRRQYDAEREAAQRQVELYRALGLIDNGVRLDTETLIQWTASSIAGFYDDRSRRLHVISDLENLGTDDKVTLAHEYTHALQDQHFDLAQYRRRSRTTDERLAQTSVYEGDATAVMSLYLYGNTTPGEWTYLAYRAAFGDRAIITATGVSTRVSDIQYFPYVQGVQFALVLLADARGWASLNHAYADPPRSTSLVLHPERYLTRPATPAPLALPDVGAALGYGWTPTLQLDTLGEFVTRVHLDEFLRASERAARAADGWAGASFALWQAADGQLAFAWQLAWDTPRDTEEVCEAYADLLRRRAGANLVAEREESHLRWYISQAGSGLVRRRNTQTLVLWGPDKATLERLLAVFK